MAIVLPGPPLAAGAVRWWALRRLDGPYPATAAAAAAGQDPRPAAAGPLTVGPLTAGPWITGPWITGPWITAGPRITAMHPLWPGRVAARPPSRSPPRPPGAR